MRNILNSRLTQQLKGTMQDKLLVLVIFFLRFCQHKNREAQNQKNIQPHSAASLNKNKNEVNKETSLCK
jgi:hypothetical protein